VDSKAECGQLNVVHTTRNKKCKTEIKTNKRQCPFSSVQIREGSPEGTRKNFGGKDL